MGSPELPVPVRRMLPAPACRCPPGRWAAALRRATAGKGVRKPAVIHFNNCFNMSVEVLHTVAPHADFATGYGNYNFFTAGEPYPEVFGSPAGGRARPHASNWRAGSRWKIRAR